MTQLWITEKPAVARAIAAALAPDHTRAATHISAGPQTFTWVIGHLLELAEPHHYDESYRQWNYDDLPIIPRQWDYRVHKDKAKQLAAIKSLIARHEMIVHAGDIGREGQLIIDEVLEHLKVKKPVKRALITNLNPDPIRQAARALQHNNDYANLSRSAKSRQLADWTVGLNLTRAYALRSAQSNISIGRVQTPLLALIVARDLAIESFTSKKFYTLTVTVTNDLDQSAQLTWHPGPAYDHLLDPDGRILQRAPLDALARDLDPQNGAITELSYKKRTTQPPLPLSLSALQTHVLADKNIKARPDDVLNAAQALYEQHKLLTYPRSDSRYLPEEHFAHAPTVIDYLKQAGQPLARIAGHASPTQKSRAFNDEKTGEHHAIIPTAEGDPDLAPLSPLERVVFIACAQHYLAQFLPPMQHTTLSLTASLLDETFKASRRYITDPGFKALMNDQAPAADEDDTLDPLPVFTNGEPVTATGPTINEKHTSPPKHFTGATLIAAMANIARFIDDPEARAILKETDGLGTEATRSAIIDVLFQRDFIVEKKKAYLATEKGRRLIAAVDDRIKSIEMTAVWESCLNAIADDGNSADFLDSINHYVEQIIDDLPQQNIAAIFNPDLITCPDCSAPMQLRNSKKGQFFGCTRYPACQRTLTTSAVPANALKAAQALAGLPAGRTRPTPRAPAKRRRTRRQTKR